MSANDQKNIKSSTKSISNTASKSPKATKVLDFNASHKKRQNDKATRAILDRASRLNW